MMEELLDHLVSEKMDYKEYEEIAEEMDNPELKAMFKKIAEDEHNHYKMLREFIAQHME